MNELLELAGLILVIAFCVVVWWPSALLVGGLALIVASATRARRDLPTEAPQ